MELVSIKNLIKILKEKDINLGKGDPYNRLRYYTKLGWIPHMVRKKDENNEITGHYPYDVINKIIKIEELKNQNFSNEDIDKFINPKSEDFKKHEFDFFKTIKKINLNYFFILIIISGFIIEAIRYNSLNEKILNKEEQKINNQILNRRIADTGISVVLPNQKTTFVPTSNINPLSIILVTFYDSIGFNNSYFIKDIKPGMGFYVETSYQVPKESKFSWVIVE